MNKKILTAPALVGMMLLMMAFATPTVSANAKVSVNGTSANISVYGLTGPKVLKTGTFTNQPISVTYKVPSGNFVYGALTPIDATFLYKSKRIKYKPTGVKLKDSFAYSRMFKQKPFKLKTKSAWNYEKGALIFNVPNPYKDYTDWKTYKLRPNVKKTVRFWVNLDRCYQWPEITTPAQQDYFKRTGFDSPPPDYACVGVTITDSWKASISGRRNGYIYHSASFGALMMSQVKIVDPQAVLPNPQG